MEPSRRVQQYCLHKGRPIRLLAAVKMIWSRPLSNYLWLAVSPEKHCRGYCHCYYDVIGLYYPHHQLVKES